MSPNKWSCIAGFYPALAGSDVVMNDKAKQIEILMEGIRGSQMQSFAEQLNEVGDGFSNYFY